MGKQISPGNSWEWESGAPVFFTIDDREGEKDEPCKATQCDPVSHVKLEVCPEGAGHGEAAL